MWDLIVSVPDHCLSFYSDQDLHCLRAGFSIKKKPQKKKKKKILETPSNERWNRPIYKAGIDHQAKKKKR